MGYHKSEEKKVTIPHSSVKFKKNNYQDLPWNNTIEEDTFRYPDLFAGGKGINVWPIVKDSTPTPCSWPF
jgi:hypothetical protein